MWLKNHRESIAKSHRNAGQYFVEYLKIAEWIDDFTIAHIGLTVTLDKLGRGQSFKTPINSVYMEIGRQLEDQAFMAYMEDASPRFFEVLQKAYLHDPVRRYDRKVYAMKHALDKSEDLNWEWMTEEQLLKMGSLVLKAIMSIPADAESGEGFFESKIVHESKTKKVRYLGFSQTGVMYRDLLQRMADSVMYKPIPMICPPLPWSLTERGGFILPPPRPYSQMIHGHQPTIPSQAAIDSLNRLQAQPYHINKFIYHLQQQLIKKTWEIGSFRSYEAESWKDEHFPLYRTEDLAAMDKDSKEYRTVMKEIKDAYHQQQLDEKEADSPRRVLALAEGVLDETFYTPWFFDSRLRMYPTGPLSVTGGDYVKALLVNANPKPITEDTKRELLIAIATSGGFDKVDKADYFTRLQWATDFVESGEFMQCILNPINSSVWRKADEPFQFLAYCEEYYAISKGFRDTTRVFIGRDMTCSAIQILSSVIGDEKAMRYTNVFPSDAVMDAYGEVARVARGLLSDTTWVSGQLELREEQRLKWNLKNPDKQREQRMVIEVEVETIDRGVVKTQVMVTGYGGTFLKKREYILAELTEKLKKKGVKLHPQDAEIVVAACIQGMEKAFPRYTELNAWFKQVASAACNAGKEHITWISPNGSEIVQEYREPIMQQVRTYAASGGHYACFISDDNGKAYTRIGWGDVRPTKHGSAIAANFTHTLDACMLQDGINSLDDDIDIFTVHDCIYFQPGYCDRIIPHFRKAFHNVVTTPVLDSLLEVNELESDVTMLEINPVDHSVCLESPYMFS